ncbi:MAG: hypothetical protein MI757_11430, partial [Pirellulales bacterium]|nr:hypothetical protein [Pirellulales bacterium]
MSAGTFDHSSVVEKEGSGGLTSLLSWVSTVDHKRIGVLYILTATVFLVVGGFEALLMRIQLAVPNNTFLEPETFNQ